VWLAAVSCADAKKHDIVVEHPPDGNVEEDPPPNDPNANADQLFVRVTQDVMDEGRSCIRIETPMATYFYDKQGAGFTSLLDKDGHDWISWSSKPQAEGEYRGVPNLGDCCHPGYTGATTRIVDARKDFLKIESTVVKSGSPTWRVSWTFSPEQATLTVEQAAAAYYLLYEGTPGGKLGTEDAAVYATQDTEQSFALTPQSSDVITTDMSPEWIYFADGALKRALLLVHHTDDATADRYWTMDNAMTVFGFGRTGHGAKKGISATPRKLTLRFMDNPTFLTAKQLVTSILR